MGELKGEQSQGNVNVTLDPSLFGLGRLGEMEFPCPLCKTGLPIRASKRNKPYCTCNSCGVQIFVRGKAGIARLREMASTGILVSGIDESVVHAINLYNRLERLKLQKQNLEAKAGIFFRGKDVENAIQIVDSEIQKAQGELGKIVFSPGLFGH